jgi:peptidyl-prolyl cis-trans isomerase A (cyclophilin A)
VKNKITSVAFALSCLFTSTIAQASVVEIRTNIGNFQVNLFDELTPQTVDNFLSYVNAGAYANNTVHRSVNDFVIQMGGFEYANDFPPEAIATGIAVVNEAVLSNVRGTLSMAKLSGRPDSATSQFFVNLSDNSAGQSRLDTENGGYSVFGQVIGNGMDIVDRIAGLPTYSFSTLFSDLPLQNYTNADQSSNVTPSDNNLVIITDIVVIDSAVSTNPSLNPSRNTLISSASQTPSSDNSGGGSMGILVICGLALVALRKWKNVKT